MSNIETNYHPEDWCEDKHDCEDQCEYKIMQDNKPAVKDKCDCEKKHDDKPIDKDKCDCKKKHNNKNHSEKKQLDNNELAEDFWNIQPYNISSIWFSSED